MKAQRGHGALVTRAVLAEQMGVVRARITKWQAEGCPVAHKSGSGRPSLFDPAAVSAWLRERGQQQRNGVALPDARARESLAKAALAEQTLRIRSGELVPVAEVESAWLVLHEAVATTVGAIPRLADRLVLLAREGGATAVQEALEAAVQKALAELSTWEAPR